MRSFFLCFFLLLFPFQWLAAAPQDSEEPFVRYRAVIYFYPDAKPVSKKTISKYLNAFKQVERLPDVAKSLTVAFDVSKKFKASFPPPDLEYLSYFGRGLNKKQAESIQKTKQAAIFQFVYPGKSIFSAIQKIDKVLLVIAEKHNGLIWDSETRELFGPKLWRSQRTGSWENGLPLVENHTVIHAYKDGEGVRAITLGMVKFGVPDVVVNDFSWSISRSVGGLLNLVSQSLLEGFSPSKKGVLLLRPRELADTSYKKELLASLYENAQDKVALQLGIAEHQEGDPENLIVEILFDTAAGKTLYEKQEAFLSALFGFEDNVSYVKSNQEIEAASARAKAKLPALRKTFNQGLAPGEVIMVKAPFETRDGGVEWMWVEVQSWEKGTIRGMLKNEPRHVADLRAGSVVEVQQVDLFDFIHRFPDGRTEGNETSSLIQKQQQSAR